MSPRTDVVVVERGAGVAARRSQSSDGRACALKQCVAVDGSSCGTHSSSSCSSAPAEGVILCEEEEEEECVQGIPSSRRAARLLKYTVL